MILKSLDDVVESIQRSHVCSFLVGAGLSVPAGIPTAEAIIVDCARRMYEEAYGSCGLDSLELKSWLSKQDFYDEARRYSSVLDAAFPSEQARSEYFEKLMIGAKPTRAYVSIANIIAKGYSDLVTTTNFDRLVEYAVLKQCGHFPIVVLSRDFPSDQSMKSWRTKVLKLHGDYLYGDIRNLDQELYIVKSNMSKKLAFALGKGPLLVAGYSGGDESVMEALESFANDSTLSKKGIFWLTLKDDPLEGRVLRLLEGLGKSIAGIVEIENGDSFFAEVADSLDIMEASRSRVYALNDKSHVATLNSFTAEQFIEKRLDGEIHAELRPLLRRRPELSPYCRTESSLDYLLSRFEERFELPLNLGETTNRYVDLLSGAFIENRNLDSNRALRIRNDLEKLGLLSVSGEAHVLYSRVLIPFLDALDLVENRTFEQVTGNLKNGTLPLPTLLMYVGLIPNATQLVAELLNSTDTPFFMFLHRHPWPEQYYLAGRLAGAAARISEPLVDRLVDLLVTEFDTEQWFPQDVIESLAAMGSLVVPHMVEYITDTGQDVFAREDSAEVLGKIGTRSVVENLKANTDMIPANDTLIVDALGRTENPQAISVLVAIAKRLSKNRNAMLQEALQKAGYKGEPLVANGETNTKLPYPKRVEIGEAVARHCPHVPHKNYSNEVTDDVFANYQSFDDYKNKRGTPVDIALLISTAERLQKRGLFQDAEAVLLECLLRYPWIYHIYHYIGLLYYQMGRFPIARRYYKLGLRLKPEFSGYYADFGLTMSELDNHEAARYLFVKAIMLDPNNHVPWYNLATTNLGLAHTKAERKFEYHGGKLFKAAKEWQFERSEDFNPNRAAICLRRVLELKPDHSFAGKMLESLRNTFNTFEQHIMDLSPSQDELSYAISYGNLLPSRPIWWAEGMPKEAFHLAMEANQMERLGRYQEGIDLMKKAIQIYPYEVRCRINIANMAKHLGRPQEAVDTIAEGLSIKPWDHDLLVSFSVFLRENEEVEQAIAAAQRAIRVNPESASAWMALCEAYKACASNKRNAAVDAFRHAMELCESWSWVALNAGEISMDLGIPEGTIW
jgi:tetratricopeptide (TPR) repeat protein